jgi:hypothetical protein
LKTSEVYVRADSNASAAALLRALIPAGGLPAGAATSWRAGGSAFIYADPFGAWLQSGALPVTSGNQAAFEQPVSDRTGDAVDECRTHRRIAAQKLHDLCMIVTGLLSYSCTSRLVRTSWAGLT